MFRNNKCIHMYQNDCTPTVKRHCPICIASHTHTNYIDKQIPICTVHSYHVHFELKYFISKGTNNKDGVAAGRKMVQIYYKL